MTSSRRLDYTDDAEDDLRSLLAHSYTTWGTPQFGVYAAQMASALDNLTRHPTLGRQRDDISLGLRSLQVGKHIIFYRIKGDVITIIRILHERMDARSRIGP